MRGRKWEAEGICSLINKDVDTMDSTQSLSLIMGIPWWSGDEPLVRRDGHPKTQKNSTHGESRNVLGVAHHSSQRNMNDNEDIDESK